MGGCHMVNAWVVGVVGRRLVVGRRVGSQHLDMLNDYQVGAHSYTPIYS